MFLEEELHNNHDTVEGIINMISFVTYMCIHTTENEHLYIIILILPIVIHPSVNMTLSSIRHESIDDNLLEKKAFYILFNHIKYTNIIFTSVYVVVLCYV